MIIDISVIAGSFIAFAAAIWQIGIQLSTQTSEIVRSRNLIAERAVAVAQLSELKRAAPEIAPYENTVNVLLPDQDQLFDFPRYLDSLSKIRSVNISFSFQNIHPSEGTAPGFAAFAMTANGSRENLIGFIKELESPSARFLVAIQSVSLSRSGTSYQANIPGRVFIK